MELFDKNKDGQLDDAELAACPGLKSAKAAFDTDKDGKVSKAEIVARFRKYAEAQPGMSTYPCRVTLQGQALVGATVTLTPEPFMLGVPAASGVTDDRGEVTLRVEGQPLPGLFCGLYRVEVRGANVPAKYSTATDLGCEVPPPNFSRTAISLAFALTTK